MKKIVSLILMLITISLCACNTNMEDNQLNNNIEQNGITNNSNESIDDNSESTNQNNLLVNNIVKNEENNEGSKDLEDTQEIIVDKEGKNEVGEDNTSDNQQSVSVPVVATSLSNDKCAWGFVRKKDEVRPEFAAKYTKVLDAYEGIYAGNPDEKVIYLTFDEGYENGYTGAILDTLKEKECPATFFVTKPYVKQNQELVKRMIDEGHIVGNHTVNHPSMPEVLDDEKLKSEVTGLHDYVKDLFGYEMEYLRPPKGEYSERTVAISKELGYKTVLWSSAYDDWDVNKQDRLEYAKKMIVNYVHNGCVMLLHAVSKDNTALLGEVIEELRTRGYEFKSLDEFEY